MSCTSWFFDKADFKKTPSIVDGITPENEARYRREGARFINKVGTKMNLRYDTMATGVAYFHRFYMCHSFKQFPRFVTACCCLFLAGKVEETPKKCKDIIKTAKSYVTEAQFAKFGEDPKEEVLTLERILLQTINFDLQVEHPYEYLLKYAKALKGDQDKLQKLVQMAWTFINDSMCTTISLQWEPEVIAIALMFLAGKLTKFDVVDWEGRTKEHKKWWDMFVEDISINLLEDICHQVLDLYSINMPETPQDSPPSSPKHQAQFDSPILPNQTNSANLTHTGPLVPHHPALQPPGLVQISGAPFPPSMPNMAAIPPIMPPHHQGLMPPPLIQAQGIPPQSNYKPPQSHLQPPMLPHATNSTNLPQTGPPMPMPQGVPPGIPPPFFAATGPPIRMPQTGPIHHPNGHPFQNM